MLYTYYTVYVPKLINNIVLLNIVLICISRILFFLLYLSKMLVTKIYFTYNYFTCSLLGLIMIVRRMALFLLSFILTNCESAKDVGTSCISSIIVPFLAHFYKSQKKITK
uniref:Uncharacterized protein n=1 Tax=Schizaphis graminum TaxID=13262 RepID=A0A2S2PAN1_SCHGA